MLKANIPRHLGLKDKIIFEDTDNNYKVEYCVAQGSSNDFYLMNIRYQNDIIFTRYGVHKFKFVEDIIGYETNRMKVFPEVKTLDDLRKVCIALQYIDEY